MKTKEHLVLAKYLEVEPGELREGRDEYTFTLGNKEYLILLDEEAESRTAEAIKESLWAFAPSFLSSYMPLDEKSIGLIQQSCESCNDAMIQLVGNRLDEVVNDAIACDGRGHFLSHYDGHEIEVEHDGVDYYIYRTN